MSPRKAVPLALITTSVFSTPVPDASAKDIDADRIMQSVEQVLEENRIYATCLSMDKNSLDFVRSNWRRMVGETRDLLRKANFDTSFLTLFELKVRAANLLDQNLSLHQAMAICHANEAMISRFYEFGFSNLRQEVEKAMAGDNVPIPSTYNEARAPAAAYP